MPNGSSAAVRPRPGRLSGLSTLRVSPSNSCLYGVFVWARGALHSQKQLFPARAAPDHPDPGVPLQQAGDGLPGRAQSHCRFVPPLIHFIPDSLTYSVPCFLKRQCDRNPLPGLRLRGAALLRLRDAAALGREEQIRDSGGPLEPPGPLPMHLRTVYMECSECLATRLSTLAERTCFSQALGCTGGFVQELQGDGAAAAGRRAGAALDGLAVLAQLVPASRRACRARR
jgi:hypothetical protein